MRAIVFGANGQDGYYLDALLHEQGVETIGVSRSGPWSRGDVGDFATVEALVREHKPDLIFHLAARSTTRHEALFENHQAISTGTINILEAAYRHRRQARVFIAGSGVQFRNTGEPIDEETPFEPSSTYAVARIHSVYAARYYRSLGLPTFVGYLFHHESPKRPPAHLSRQIALAAQRIANGSIERLAIGDVSVIKEWNFAGDIASAILTLVRQDVVSEAVIGSGEGHSVEEWLNLCFTLAGKSWREHVDITPGFKPEYPVLVSRPKRMRSLGWAPRVGFDLLAKLMMKPDGS
jgi:GDPmannose 4,6-dehydratase